MYLYLTCSLGKISPFSFTMKFDIFCEYFVFHNCPCSPVQALLWTARTPSHLIIEYTLQEFPPLCLSPVLCSWRQREWGALYAWSWGIVVLPIYIFFLHHLPIYIVSRTSSVIITMSHLYIFNKEHILFFTPKLWGDFKFPLIHLLDDKLYFCNWRYNHFIRFI